MYDTDTRRITTQRLILRPFVLSDAEAVCGLCNNVNVSRGTLSLPYPYSIENALGWIPSHKDNFDQDKAYEFAITDKKTGMLYGCIGLTNNQRHRNGEAGYWIGEEFWGRGYATEALAAVIRFAFLQKGYHKVLARHFESNPASGRVMQKAGMKPEGKQRDQVFKEKEFKTLLLYGIVNENHT